MDDDEDNGDNDYYKNHKDSNREVGDLKKMYLK